MSDGWLTMEKIYNTKETGTVNFKPKQVNFIIDRVKLALALQSGFQNVQQ